MDASVQRLLFLVVLYSNIRSLAHAAVGDLLWSDEFNTSFNTSVWNVRTGAGGWGNFELQEYTADSVRVVNNSALEILVRRRSGDNVFTSGRVDTAKTVELLYGRIEARIRTPDVVEGLWPAFWTLGSSFSNGIAWPACGEVDIMEVGQGLALTEGLGNRRVVSGAHWEVQDRYATYASSKDVDFDLSNDYSVFILDWTSQALVTYVNGAEIWRMDIDSASCQDCEEFHKPHFLVLNVAVGGQFTSGSKSTSSASTGCGSSTSTTTTTTTTTTNNLDENCGPVRTAENITASLPAAMMVDWVRIFDNGNATLTYSSNSAVTLLTSSPVVPTAVPTPMRQTDGLLPRPTNVSPTPAPTRFTLIPSPPPRPSPTDNPTRKPVNMILTSNNAGVPTTRPPYPPPQYIANAADDDDDDIDDDDECSGKGKSEKSSKGGSERRRKSKSCDKAKSKKGKKDKKKGDESQSDEYESLGISSTTTAFQCMSTATTVTAILLAAGMVLFAR